MDVHGLCFGRGRPAFKISKDASPKRKLLRSTQVPHSGLDHPTSLPRTRAVGNSSRRSYAEYQASFTYSYNAISTHHTSTFTPRLPSSVLLLLLRSIRSCSSTISAAICFNNTSSPCINNHHLDSSLAYLLSPFLANLKALLKLLGSAIIPKARNATS